MHRIVAGEFLLNVSVSNAIKMSDSDIMSWGKVSY